MLATYILDEEMDLDVTEQMEEEVEELRNQYPIGFFSSL